MKPAILVIEDEAPLRKFLRVTLEMSDYRVVEASGGKEGLEQAIKSRPDLIVLDLGLPDLDGVELTRKLREWSTVPVVVVSARGREQDKVAALDAGADDYLTKPFGVDELKARVRVALRHAAATKQEDGEPVFQTGGLKIDLLRRGERGWRDRAI